MVSNSHPYHLLRREKWMRPCVLKCQQTVYKTRSPQRRPVPSPAFYHIRGYRYVIANKKVKGKPQPKRGKAPKKKEVRRVNPSSRSRSQPRGLSHCASLYATAIAKPFEMMEGVCIPSGSGPSRPSQKVRTIGRFVAAVGTQKFGFALITPCLANDGVAAIFSTSSYSASQAAPFGLPATEYSSTVLSALPYSKTAFTVGDEFRTGSVHGRFVSYGVRWRYIGTELERSGRVYSLVHPDHDNLYGCSFTSLGAFKECLTTHCSRSWTEQVVFSNTSTEVDYPVNNLTFANSIATPAAQEELLTTYTMSSCQFLSNAVASPYTAGTVIGGAPMAIVFDGTAGNLYEFEIVAHVEYVGTITQSMLTKSHADPVGFSVVQEAANGLGLARQYIANQASAMASGLMSAAASQTGTEIRNAATIMATKSIARSMRGSMLAIL